MGRGMINGENLRIKKMPRFKLDSAVGGKSNPQNI